MKNGNDLIHQALSNLFISIRIRTKVITKSKRLEVIKEMRNVLMYLTF